MQRRSPDGPFDLVLDLVGARAARRRWPASEPGGRLVTVPTITAQQIKDAGRLPVSRLSACWSIPIERS